jgi:hypothetical protein
MVSPILGSIPGFFISMNWWLSGEAMSKPGEGKSVYMSVRFLIVNTAGIAIL